MLQVKLSVLKEEKRLLMLKLKQRELQIRRELEAANNQVRHIKLEPFNKMNDFDSCILKFGRAG